MDLKQFVNQFIPMTCIISVDKLPDGSFGNIKIVTGNDAYINAAESYRSVGAADIFKTSFVPDSPYERYMPKDLNFEDYCYRCAVLGQPLHTYVHPERFDFWINLTMMPIISDKENTYYCTYSQEFTRKANSSLMTNLPPEIANSVLETCFKLKGSNDFDATMNSIINDIRALCGASHCCILLSDFDQRKCSVLCESLSENTNLISMYNYVNDDFFDIVKTWPDTIAGSTCLIVKDESDMAVLKERNPVWHSSLVSASTKSMVLFPLKAGKETLGFIWAINFDINNTVNIKETLELTTFFLAAEISNYQLFRRLERIGSIDMLTGVFNRNAMNNRIDKICSQGDDSMEMAGIVFADLNGLKTVNDTIGHYAGDMLLKSAALVLQKCYPECEIYRAGGDEFMVIAPDMPEAMLLKRARLFEKKAVNPAGVSFSIGCCCDTVENIRKSMHTADERMYENKQKYYELHPEKRR